MFKQLSQYDFHHVLEESRGLVIVLFTAPSCSSCQQWKQLLSEYCATHGDVEVFAVDAGHEAALAREFELFHLPALFLYIDGTYHAPIQCEARLCRFDETIQKLQLLPAEDEP